VPPVAIFAGNKKAVTPKLSNADPKVINIIFLISDEAKVMSIKNLKDNMGKDIITLDLD
jgi:hypothetical protein